MLKIGTIHRDSLHCGLHNFVGTLCIATPGTDTWRKGNPFLAIKVPRLQGGLRPRLRTPDAWVVMPWRWDHIRELVAEPSQQGLLARPLSIGLSVETQLSWVRMQTPNPKQTLLGSTPKGPKPQPHWVRPRTHPPTLLAYDNKGPTPKPGA